MKLPEWDKLPKNKYIIILNQCGNESLQIEHWKGDYFKPAKDITCTTVTVYNENTDRVSDKSAYKSKDGRLYIKCKPHGYGGGNEKLYLDEFK